ncbi:XrtA system polysaccharide chain length determinant [Pseudoxanthomonas kalamensis]|uniref:XrtA system polysaccharide chain length determinant n=1 Tax=Pseudoxanthomonas kalamensis TaxID=289483 RepID=UPI001391A9BE|nr:XrtA system polysaccharide chain length determinant [Pseudoxanthomonas kalamensis]
MPIGLKEIQRRPVILAGIFTAIALMALLVGLLLPKKYSSTTSIFVEDRNIIAPLMEGRAVATSVNDRASILREVAFSRRVMDEILETGGWMEDDPSPLEQEKLIEKIVDRTTISNSSPNLIDIAYTDSDPERAFHVTKRLADLVISESLATKERESSEAYAFIDSQVKQYHDKLTQAEADLEDFRQTNPDARPGTDADVNARIGELRRIIESSRMDLIDAHSRESALQSQLSGESEITLVQTRAGQFRARLAELQAERDRLLLQYTDRHPDVMRVQHQIADLQEELRREESRPRVSSAGQSLDGPAAFNPLYGELKSKLADARRQSAATSARISSAEAMLSNELARSNRIASSESKLAELTRDYEVNRDLYQDLLKRRENARVSMNLDAERRGLTFRIQEPAAMPLRPSGLRTMHVAVAGLLLGLLASLGLLFSMIKFDPRVRSASQIESEARLPVLSTIPSYVTGRDRRRHFRRYAIAATVFLTVPVAYGLVYLLKSTGAL